MPLYVFFALLFCKKTLGFYLTFLALWRYYFFFVGAFFVGAFLVIIVFVGALVMVFFVGLFFMITFLVGVCVIFFATGVLVCAGVLVRFLLRYFESSNARIGMNMILRNIIPSPNVQSFQNLVGILNILMIIIIANNGGKKIESAHRPESHQSLNINVRLYTGTKIPHPGNHAFLNIFHREIIISTASPNRMVARMTVSHQNTAHITAPIHIIASWLMFPVSNAHESSKEKFIM